MEGIDQHGRAHDVTHLGLVHARFELIDLFLRNDISLLDIGLVHEGGLRHGVRDRIAHVTVADTAGEAVGADCQRTNEKNSHLTASNFRVY